MMNQMNKSQWKDSCTQLPFLEMASYQTQRESLGISLQRKKVISGKLA